MNKNKSEPDLLSDFMYLAEKQTNTVINLLSTMVVDGSVDDNVISILDLSVFKTQIDELFEYLVLYKRFRALDLATQGALKAGKGKFIIDNFSFDTLDEVEKAWKNKSFI